MVEKSYDVIVIGAGPGGYVAAIRAAQLGYKTAVIEREHLGGICLNWGCIPTKALLRAAEIYHLIQNAKAYGIHADNVSFDLPKLIARSRKVADKLSRGVGHLMKKNKITVIDGDATLLGKSKIGVTKDGSSIAEYDAPHIIIATGSRAKELPHMPVDGKMICTYKQAMVPESLPKSLLVIGSGAIGIEFASFYRTLGVQVSVVEKMDRILPLEDEEISALAAKAFIKSGMNLLTGSIAESVKKSSSNLITTIKNAVGELQKIETERIILAIGITGNVENIGLENVGVTVDQGNIHTDGWGRTDVEGIYAIGDVAGPPWLAHKAMHEGVICVEKIAGLTNVHPINPNNIPACTYSSPQIASVGMSEAAAIEAGHEVKVGRYPFLANGKAIALGESEGTIKTVFDTATGELLGAHMIGTDVTELIQGYTIAKTMEGTEEELMHTVFPHPTLSEMMHESVLNAYGRTLHL